MAASKKPKMKDLPKKAVGAKKAAQVKGVMKKKAARLR
jgi:hypothetical protein